MVTGESLYYSTGKKNFIFYFYFFFKLALALCSLLLGGSACLPACKYPNDVYHFSYLYNNSKKRRALGHSEPPKAVTGVPLIFNHRVNSPWTSNQHDNKGSIRGLYLGNRRRYSKITAHIRFLVSKTIGNDTHHDMNR